MNPFNVCTLVGHVPAHQSFKPVYMAGDDQRRSRYSATLSVKRNIKKQGEQYYPEDLIRFTAWGASADFLNNYAPPGTTIVISGSLNVDTVDKNGTKMTYYSVVADNVRIVGSSERSSQGTSKEEQEQTPPPAPINNPFHKGQGAKAAAGLSAAPVTQEQTVERVNPFSKGSQ